MSFKSWAKDTYKSLSSSGNTQVTEQKKKVLETTAKAVYQARQDIKRWKDAVTLTKALEPTNYAFQLLLTDVMTDALLTSQVENRIGQIFSLDFVLKDAKGEVNQEQTDILKKHSLYRFLTRQGLNSIYYEYSLVELSMTSTMDDELVLTGDLVPRANVVPQTGYFYPDYTDRINKIAYRDLPEFRTWILEYYNKEGGLLNKAVPHVLFKRFAQTCWSQLCEIYGVPPRVMKTNTADKNMLARAQKMMKDMGNAAYFIIDEDETFEWAQGVTTNGDVYSNLISLCRDEICLLIVGAIIGQNTENGSRSKDEAAQEMLWLLVQSDMELVTEQWNTINLPALVKHGVVSADLRFEFVPTEDTEQLFEMVMKSLEYFNVDAAWFEDKFGVKITTAREQPMSSKDKNNKTLVADLLAGANDFFVTPRRRKRV